MRNRWRRLCRRSAAYWVEQERRMLSVAAESPKQTTRHQAAMLHARWARLRAEIWLALGPEGDTT